MSSPGDADTHTEEHVLPPPAPGLARSPEDRERERARERGKRRDGDVESTPADGRTVHGGRASAGVAARAFSMLADSVRDYAIFLVDAEGVITFWGDGARQLVGWTPNEAEGAHLRLLYPGDGSDDGDAELHLRSAMEQGQFSAEGYRVRRDGTTFWADATIAPLRNASGELLGFAHVTRDLTARRQADALLTSAAAAAEAAREAAVANASARMEFLATVSHEIRTPVNAIIGYHELLDMELGGPLSDIQRSYIARASASGRHLLAIIDEVLDFARLDADRVYVGRKAFTLGTVIAEGLTIVTPQARRRRIAVTYAGEPTARTLAACGDPTRARQILVNLLSNAVKFTEPRDGSAGRLTVSAGKSDAPPPDAKLSGRGPWVFVRVEDTGPGIPRDRLDAIFEPFVQADMTLTRRHGGTGLGLAISRRLARLMEGDLIARSELGVGSTFILWLPFASPEHMDAAADEAEPRQLDRRHDPMVPPWTVDDLAPERAGALAEIAHAILDQLEEVLRRYTARLRVDPATPSAHQEDASRVEDHLATYLADLAATLTNVDDPERDATDTLSDSSAIQRMIARKHGEQRARLGWGAHEVLREFAIMEEELISAVRRAAPRHLQTSSASAREEELARALKLLSHFVAVARRLSVESYMQAADARTGARP